MGVSGVPLENKHPHFNSQHSICPLDCMITEALGNTMDLREQRQKKNTVFVDYSPIEQSNTKGWKLLLDS